MYAMFTRAGNNAVRMMIEIAVGLPPAEQLNFLRGKMEIIASKHDEVYDTAVREEIVAAVGNPANHTWRNARVVRASGAHGHAPLMSQPNGDYYHDDVLQ